MPRPSLAQLLAVNHIHRAMSLLVLEDAFSCAVILRRALATAGRGHDCKPARASPLRTTFGLTLRSSLIARKLSPCPIYGKPWPCSSDYGLGNGLEVAIAQSPQLFHYTMPRNLSSWSCCGPDVRWCGGPAGPGGSVSDPCATYEIRCAGLHPRCMAQCGEVVPVAKGRRSPLSLPLTSLNRTPLARSDDHPGNATPHRLPKRSPDAADTDLALSYWRSRQPLGRTR